VNMTYGCMCTGTAHESNCFVNRSIGTNVIPPTPMQRGWKCPECGRGYSPWYRGPCNHTDRISGITETANEKA